MAVDSVTTWIEEVDGVRSMVPASKPAVDNSEESTSSFLLRRRARSDFSAKLNPL